MFFFFSKEEQKTAFSHWICFVGQMPTTGGKKWFPFPGFQHFFTKRMLPSDRDLDPCFEQRLFYPSLGGRGSFEISWKSNGAWKTREGRSIALRSKVRWCNNWYRYRCNSINFSLFNLQQLCLLSISFVSSLKIFAMVYLIQAKRENLTSIPLYLFPDNFWLDANRRVWWKVYRLPEIVFVIGRQTNLQREEANISRRGRAGRRKLKEREPVQRVMKYDTDTRILAEIYTKLNRIENTPCVLSPTFMFYQFFAKGKNNYNIVKLLCFPFPY